MATEIRRLARYQPNIKVVTLCGGVSIGPQIGSLEHGAHIVVGTPGRIKDHLSKETLSLARTNMVVLDEADRMLEMGFVDDMVSILEETPADRQTLLFSATYPKDIAAISARFQHSPVQIAVEASDDDNTIEQKMFVCSKQERLDGLVKLLTHFKPHTAVIFCNTKQTATPESLSRRFLPVRTTEPLHFVSRPLCSPSCLCIIASASK